MENWRDIPGYEGIYQASDLGRIRSAPGKTTSNSRYSKRVWKSRILKPKAQVNSGRVDYRVSLWKDGNHKDALVARLVAMAWCDGFSEGLTVNHKDGDYRNNTPENLEWVTLAENIRHGFETGLYKNSMNRVLLVATATGSMRLFSSMKAASRFLGRCDGYISGAVKNGGHVTGKNGDAYIAILQN